MLENIEQCSPPPLAVGHAPNMFCQQPGASITQPNFSNPELEQLSCLQSNCQKSGGSILCGTPLHKEEVKEESVSWQLLVDRSSSVICKKHQEFLIIRPPLVDQPKPSAFYQETGTARCSQMTNALLQLFLTTFNWIADSFDESQLFDKKWSKGESLSSSERFRERLRKRGQW